MKNPSRVRRERARNRRERSEAIHAAAVAQQSAAQRGLPPEPRRPSGPAIGPGVGWDHDAPLSNAHPVPETREHHELGAELLSLFAEPGIYTVTPQSAAETLSRPLAEVENGLEALAVAGEIIRSGDTAPRYYVTEARKADLERLFHEAAQELGETQALVRYHTQSLAAYEDGEEPRLPVTAGLLSLFLPGTGQLLNGDVGRASLVFAVWSLALLTHLSPIWTFVALYAGAEAFFTAKVRGIERRLELDAHPEPSEG